MTAFPYQVGFTEIPETLMPDFTERYFMVKDIPIIGWGALMLLQG